jgi:hypothetical protein
MSGFICLFVVIYILVVGVLRIEIIPNIVGLARLFGAASISPR